MTKHKFELIGLGDHGNLVQEQKIPENWNYIHGMYSFRYKKGSSTFLVKMMTVDLNRILLNAQIVDQNRASVQFELSPNEYVDETKFLDETKLKVEKGKSDEGSTQKIDWPKFLRKEKMTELMNTIETRIIKVFILAGEEKNIPNIQAPTISTIGEQNNQDRQGRLYVDQLPLMPTQDFPPRQFVGQGEAGRFRYGDRDLFPEAFPMSGEGGGSSMGPRHPGFGGRVNDPYYDERSRGMYRGIKMPPPGARFDPFGPPGINDPLLDSRSSSVWRRNQPPDGLSRQELPDPDHQEPPGFDDMYI
ncbi:proteasome inhibitor PI31 subunit-like [Schistocerca gregaria]|uniref:proteasome inhibitor PI31 subunit-like n=1 Tax=Schistocerca gregaria TaxID=7010 RepID=UPI00211E87B1|nr:proteasome inhibitor PI31 subunit-like [Schistocerca gregaria]